MTLTDDYDDGHDDTEHEPQAETTTGNQVLPFRSAVPASFSELQRKHGPRPTINDLVEAEVEKLWPDSAFQKLISAIFKEESVEGSLRADDQEAARMIREHCAEGHPLTEKKLEAIRHSLNIVLRRFGESRNERRFRFVADEGQGQIES